MTIEFQVKSWSENTWEGKPAQEITTEKRTYSKVEYNYRGEIEGESEIQYVMSYREDSTGNFVAIEHIKGSIDGKSGTVTLQHIGTFDKTSVNGTFEVVAATGGLAGIKGTGTIVLDGHLEWYPMTFGYSW